MSKPTQISISNFEILLEHIKRAPLGVEWTVRCEFGPDWIGGGRAICFYWDNRPLADTALHSALKEALVHALNVPDSSPDALIQGEGELYFRNGQLELEYDWFEAVPYMHARNSDGGKVVLVIDA